MIDDIIDFFLCCEMCSHNSEAETDSLSVGLNSVGQTILLVMTAFFSMAGMGLRMAKYLSGLGCF